MTIDTFLEKLSKTVEHFKAKGQWTVGTIDNLRLRGDYYGSFYYCPITAVCKMETGVDVGITEAGREGAALLRLERKDVEQIISAADDLNYAAGYSEEFRKKLLKTVGIDNEA